MPEGQVLMDSAELSRTPASTGGLRIPEPAATRMLAVTVNASLPQLAQTDALRGFMAPPALDQVAAALSCDLRKRLPLPDGVLVVVVGKLFSLLELAHGPGNSVAGRLQNLVERIYLANPQLREREYLALGAEIGEWPSRWTHSRPTGSGDSATLEAGLPVLLSGPADAMTQLTADLDRLRAPWTVPVFGPPPERILARRNLGANTLP